MTRLLEKISNESGETLAETLVSLLVASVSIVMLSVAVSAGFSILKRADDAAQRYCSSTNSLISGGSASGQIKVTTTSSSDAFVFSDSPYSIIASPDMTLPGNTIAVTYALP